MSHKEAERYRLMLIQRALYEVRTLLRTTVSFQTQPSVKFHRNGVEVTGTALAVLSRGRSLTIEVLFRAAHLQPFSYYYQSLSAGPIAPCCHASTLQGRPLNCYGDAVQAYMDSSPVSPDAPVESPPSC
jgi:hypothetical protein